MIKLEGVDFSYPSSLVPVFSGLTFTADESWKTGLVGVFLHELSKRIVNR